MHITDLHPDFRGAARRVPALPFGSRFWLPLLRLLVRLGLRSPVADGVEVHDLRLGHVPLRVYVPRARCSGAGLLWVHGGGLIAGTERMDNDVCSTYAQALGLVVVSVGYRLAPEHPFPAALDDCGAAWTWFVEQARAFGVDPTRIAVVGVSGGACHAASLVHRLRDVGGTQPAAQALIQPMIDDRTAADPALDTRYFMWRCKDNRAGWRFYLGTAPGAPTAPRYAVPARLEDVSRLPPTWIGCGDKDLFFGEAGRHGERLKAAGVETTFVTVPGAPHGFHRVVPQAPASVEFVAAHHRWLAAQLGVER